MGSRMTDRRGKGKGVVFLCFLPSLEVSWLFSWLYLSALGGSGGWVSFSSRRSRLPLDYKEERRVLKASKTGGGTVDEVNEKYMCLHQRTS